LKRLVNVCPESKRDSSPRNAQGGDFLADEAIYRRALCRQVRSISPRLRSGEFPTPWYDSSICSGIALANDSSQDCGKRG
jgi:hypothetical protein